MNDMIDILEHTAARLFTDLCTDAAYKASNDGTWPTTLWDQAAKTGLTYAVDSESESEQPLPLSVLATLIRTSAAMAAPIPLAETLLAQTALMAAGLKPFEGPLSIAASLATDTLTIERRDSTWQLSGSLNRVPWGRHVVGVVAIARYADSYATVYIETPPDARHGSNYANEPRDSFVFDSLPVPEKHVGIPGKGLDPARLYLHGALWRAAQMAGAMQTALSLTLRYSGERVQFGRPIGKFQAIQQQVSVMAAQVAASSAAVEAAIAAAERGPASFEMAAAKARVSEAAGIVTEIAHQVHGAMGFTLEHPLQRSTRRLMAWRDEFGSETEWQMEIGQWIARAGAPALWSFVTAPEDFSHLTNPMHV